MGLGLVFIVLFVVYATLVIYYISRLASLADKHVNYKTTNDAELLLEQAKKKNEKMLDDIVKTCEVEKKRGRKKKTTA